MTEDVQIRQMITSVWNQVSIASVIGLFLLETNTFKLNVKLHSFIL